MGPPPDVEEQAEHNDQAGWAGCKGRQQVLTNRSLNDKNRGTQATTAAHGKSAELVAAGPNVYNKEAETGSDGEVGPASKEEDTVLPDLDQGSAMARFRGEGPPMGSCGALGGRAGGEIPPLTQGQANHLPRAGLPVFNSVPADWAGFRWGFQTIKDGQHSDALYLLQLKTRILKEGQNLLSGIRSADKAWQVLGDFYDNKDSGAATGGIKEKVGLLSFAAITAAVDVDAKRLDTRK